VLDGDFSLQALGANAFGQQIGPLIDTGNLNGGLLDIPIYQNSFGLNFGSVGSSGFEIDQLPPGYGLVIPRGWGLTYPSSLRGQSPYDSPNPIYAVDLDDDVCSPLQIGYGLCPDQQLVGMTSPQAVDSDGNPVFIEDQGIFDQVDVIPGPDSGDAELESLLASVGYTPGLPNFSIPLGAPALESVAEPPAWTLLLLSAGLIGAWRQRRGTAAFAGSATAGWPAARGSRCGRRQVGS
jgi:hypothetical protein